MILNRVTRMILHSKASRTGTRAAENLIHIERTSMEKLTLYLSPTEFANIRGISISRVFEEIRRGAIPYQITEDGIRIPVTYEFEQ